MKYLLRIIGVVFSGFASSCVSTTIYNPHCEIVDYGIMPGVSDKRILEPLSDGSNRKLGKVNVFIEIVETTNVIQAKLGRSFGISHVFSDAPRNTKIKLITIHPEINYDGVISTGGTRYKKITDNGTSFAFDLAEEMAPGKWSFIYSYSDIELCRVDFTVLPAQE